jgi:hypothetical protein
MSGFSKVAQTLISRTNPVIAKSNREAGDHLVALDNAGFSVPELFQEYRTLYDACEDEEKMIKKQILDTIVKVRGLMTPDEAARAVPSFNITIVGNDSKVAMMLCPASGGNS